LDKAFNCENKESQITQNGKTQNKSGCENNLLYSI